MPSRRIIGHANADGSCSFEGVPGWEDYGIAGRAAIVNGKPCMIALTIEPTGDDPSALTGARMKALPLEALARIALAAVNTTMAADAQAAMRKLLRAETVKHDPRASATVEAVAGVWRIAHDTGKPPRAAVMRELHVSARTADRYIARAREEGLLPMPDTPARASSRVPETSKPNPASDNRGASPTTKGATQ